jgi:hypothetical protein
MHQFALYLLDEHGDVVETLYINSSLLCILFCISSEAYRIATVVKAIIYKDSVVIVNDWQSAVLIINTTDGTKLESNISAVISNIRCALAVGDVLWLGASSGEPANNAILRISLPSIELIQTELVQGIVNGIAVRNNTVCIFMRSTIQDNNRRFSWRLYKSR